jgi:rod shape-determining protein MreC
MKIFQSDTWKAIAIGIFALGLIVLALSGYLSPIIATVSRPFLGAQGWLTERYTAITLVLNSPQDVNELRVRNLELENEVARLRSQIVSLEQQLSESRGLEELLGYARSQPGYQYTASAVIGRDPSPFLHYIIIDHGSDDGLRKGMPVITQSGLVGRIDAVTAGASRVQLINDPSAVVNIKLQKQKIDAQIQGSVTGEIGLDMVPQDTLLEAGDVILTSGLGGNYPADILIGQVISIRKLENDLFQTATVQPVVDFSQLQAVLVIRNFKPVDLTPLITGTNQ